MSAAPKMTIRQIAEAAGCNHKTVREVAARIYPEMAHNGVRLEFCASEAYAIMVELPKRNMVGPSQNQEGNLPKNGKVRISGAILHEMRLIYGPQEAGRRIDALIGFPPPVQSLAIAAPVAINLGKISKAAYAVEMRERAKEDAKAVERSLTRDMFAD